MTDGDRISVAEREANAALRLANETTVMKRRLLRVAIVATAARRLAKTNASTILTLGQSRSVVAPIWLIAALLAVIAGEGAALLLR